LQRYLHESLGISFFYRGKFREAQTEFEMALRVAERAYGERSLLSVRTIGGLGMTAGARGDHDKALALFERSPRIVIDGAGAPKPTGVRIRMQIGRELGELLRGAEAEMELREALQCAERDLGPDYNDRLEFLLSGQLGRALVDQGKSTEALRLFK